MRARLDRGAAPGTWAIAIHGGAGYFGKDSSQKRKDAYFASLRSALELGRRELASGRPAVEVVEMVTRTMEDDELFNAGRGAVFTHKGEHELDASIMDGSDLACGAVSGVQTVKNPIGLARLVMRESPHVFLSGTGAETFASEKGVERVPNTYFSTEKRRRSWRKKRATSLAVVRDPQEKMGTVGCVVLDQAGNLAAATSTGGLTGKRWGRIGDSPVVGAGTWADNRNCAVSCTGKGEEYIRRCVARDVAALYEYAELSLEEATRRVVFEKLEAGHGGLIAVSRTGEISLPYNTPSMFRGAAHSNGRFEVKIWE